MSEAQWEVLEEVAGPAQAEILGGLLEAQGIPVVLSQEGAGHSAYALTVGPLGRVQILVPSSAMKNARQVLADYYAGVFEAGNEDETGTPEDEDLDQG